VQWLPWQDAAATASGMAVATRTLKRPAQAAAWTRELSVVFALYALWQLAGNLSLGRAAGAVARGAWIARAEARLHLPSEASVQRIFLGDHAVLRAFNLYYVGLLAIFAAARTTAKRVALFPERWLERRQFVAKSNG
jgi:hypothetical protein